MWLQGLLAATFHTMEKITKRLVYRISGGQARAVEDSLVVEQEITLYVNGQRGISSASSPGKLREWAYGYLLSSGMIGNADDVGSLHEEAQEIRVKLHASEPIVVPTPIEVSFRIPIDLMLATAARVHQQGEIFQRTGGTHAAAICDTAGEMVLVEDISRTCAMEKAIGEALLAGGDFSSSFMFLSSRISSQMLVKIAHCGIPIVGCISAPTAQAVDLADKLGICLCGFIRGERLNVYSHKERIIL